jgi:hypothetical protein
LSCSLLLLLLLLLLLFRSCCCSFDDVKASYDIFNCLNLSFWEYMLPGEQGLGFVAQVFGSRVQPLPTIPIARVWR